MITPPPFDPDNVTTGGTGGTTVTVTTLNPTGAGSLIEALNLPYKRVINFSVAGLIDFGGVNQNIQGKSDFTLDFSDAPGSGVGVVNGQLSFNGCGYGIIQHGRFYAYGLQAPPSGTGGVVIARGSHHMILRKCSVFYTSDDAINIFLEANYPHVHDILIEDCVSGFHMFTSAGKGMLLSRSDGEGVGDVYNICLRRNLIANTGARCPKIKGPTAVETNRLYNVECVNNITFNTTGAKPELENKIQNVRYEHNLYIHSAATNKDRDFTAYCSQANQVALATNVYHANNWAMRHDGELTTVRAAIVDALTNSAYDFADSDPLGWTATVDDAADLYAAIITGRTAGASLPIRDDLTELVYSTIENATGFLVDVDPAETGINTEGTYPGVPDLTA